LFSIGLAIVTSSKDRCCLSVVPFRQSVCLSVSRLTEKKHMSRFHWNLVSWLGLPCSTNRKNLELTFGGAAVQNTDSESLFHLPHHYGMGDFRRFISNSHTITGRFLRYSLDEMTDADNAVNPQHFGSDPVDVRIRSRLIRKSGLEFRITFG